MSFGSGGFGFGQNNQQSTGFGGFGANNNNTTTGFGTNTTTFGSAQNTGTGLFGNTSNTGFGSTTGGFGSNTAGGFGAKPAFGAATTSTGSLFGSTTATAGGTGFGSGGGFGAPMASSNTTGGFGSGTTSMFGGASKPAFGASTTTGGLFGSATGTSTTAFGSNTTGFGAATATANAGDPPGTNTVPFQAFVEKEATSNQHNSFQNILFMDAYKKWSPEELRLTDYNQGRRFGNASGSTGAFGVGSNFGGFGASSTPAASTGTGLFGSGNTGTTGFGAQPAATTGGFGSTPASGGLFGAKPATGGLFGSTMTTPAQTGGLFGSSTTGGFGSTPAAGGFGANTNTTTGGGLFGNTATQNKPATGFGFGSTTTGTTGGFGAGTTTNTGGFGTAATNTGTTGGGLFGNTGAATGTSTGGGLFGGGAQTGATGTTTGFGSGATTGFGAQPQASGGLFGAKPAATGGLFGSAPAATTNTNTGGGLFGGATNTNTSFGGGATQQTGGLFGAKPAAPATGGGLFGNAQPAAGTTTGGGLFGGMGQQQAAQPAQQSGGLFGGGGLGQTAQKPSLFGASAPATGGGLFGGQTQQQQPAGGGLFGQSTAQAQPQASGLGGSMFGNSQQGANLGASQTGLTTSINDTGAYGAPSLFQSLASQEVQNPGPLATPLSVNKNKTSRRSSILPLYKMNPGSASKFATPQKRGYGFSYSTTGTPSSVGSTSSTPGALSQSYLGGSIGRGGLSKSISSSNLRRTFNPEDSVLLPGAFSSNSGPRFYGNSGGSSKKLVINRDMRSDLFSTPTKTKSATSGDLAADSGTATSSRKLTKRVSFDTTIATDTVPEQGAEGSNDPDMGYLRPQTRSNGAANGGSSSSNGSPSVVLSPATPSQPEMEQVSSSSSAGKELAIVHEEESPRCIPDNYRVNSKELGDYWMIPSRAEIEKMNRVQRQQVANFTVGRTNVGQVRFRVPVDLTKINLDSILDGIVTLITRSATVYPDVNTKPPVGSGLNVPAEIMLLHTCPRSGSEGNPAKMKKHIQRLKSIPDTTFVSYDEKTAAWVFRVEHFTTYGLDDDDDETEAETTTMSAGGDASFANANGVPSVERRRKHASVPGAFDDNDNMMDDDERDSADEDEVDEPSFLSSRSADKSSQALVAIQAMDDDEDDVMGLGTGRGLYSGEGDEASLGQQPASAAELTTQNSLDFSRFAPSLPPAVTETPAGIMRARLRAIKESSTPVKLQVADGDNWMEMLQKTVSPQKRDRAALQALGEHGAPEKPAALSFKESTNFRSTFNNKAAASTRGWPGKQNDNRGFATSIDLMNSLFEKAKAPASTVQPADIAPVKGFVKWPYKRHQPSDADADAATDAANDARDAVKPIWSTDGSCIVAETTSSVEPLLKRLRVFDGTDAGPRDDPLDNLADHKAAVDVEVVDGVPGASTARLPAIKAFASWCEQGNQRRSASAEPAAKALGTYEQSVWELASVLFDPIEGLAPADKARLRRDNLSKFWAQLVQDIVPPSTKMPLSSSSSSSSVEATAMLQLAAHKVPEACRTLADGKNLKLATLVSLIGSSDAFKRDMGEQLDAWQQSDVLAEFSPGLRALYALLAGHVAVCEGKRGGGIENRVTRTVLSTYFGLDWKQAFGLRLWYGIASGDDIASAVGKYVEDLEKGHVPAPQPWYVADNNRDSTADSPREDMLFGLLKVAARLARLDDVLEPANAQPSACRYRFCWQLNQALSMAPLSTLPAKLPTDKADALTTSYAAEVLAHGGGSDSDNNANNDNNGTAWVHAVWVLLHLSDRTARTQAIQDVLGRHAGSLFANNGSRALGLYESVVTGLAIPAQWVWQAAALYWRNQQDQPLLEAECLLRAAAYADAHRIFVRQLAPKAVVERNYGDIADMLAKLQPHRQHIADWALGGDVYARFLDLVNQGEGGDGSPGSPVAPRTRSRQQQVRDEAEQASAQLISTVEALVASLPAMYDNARSAQPMEVAAITEMADAVARETMVLANKGRMDLTKISRLPLTQDRRVRYSTDLAFAYYRTVMSA